MTVTEALSTAVLERLLPERATAAMVPWGPAEAAERGIYGFDSRDMRSRPFNLLRSRLSKLYRAKQWRLFGVVSATPGVGKSFIATNMAAAISRTPGLPTYLCDLDLRRGSVAANFGRSDAAGVRLFLEGDRDALRRESFVPEGQNLVVIPTDSSPVHSAELLAGPAMDDFIGAMRADPGAVFICDLPPVFANDDAAIVTTKLDAYFLVVENGQTTKKQIRDSVEVLDQSTCAGVILNRYTGGLVSDTYGYSYGTTGGYGNYFGS